MYVCAWNQVLRWATVFSLPWSWQTISLFWVFFPCSSPSCPASFFLLFLSIHGFFMRIYCALFSLVPSLTVVPGPSSQCGSPIWFLTLYILSLFPTSLKAFYSYLMIYFLVLWHINKHIILNIGSAYLRKHTVNGFVSLNIMLFSCICFSR